eukprot:COSAG02_NODE_1154_length_14189_cov_10.515614_7_plen_73_part_00
MPRMPVARCHDRAGTADQQLSRRHTVGYDIHYQYRGTAYTLQLYPGYRPGQIQVAGDRFQNRAKYPIKFKSA